MINADEGDDYALFGKIVLLWGHVEAALINIVLRVPHPLNRLSGHDGVPTPFSRKITLAKRGYHDIPKLASIKDDACLLLDSLEPLHRSRSIIVHGYYQGFTGGDQYMFGMYESRRPLRKRAFTFHYFTRDELAQLNSKIEVSRRQLEELSATTFRLCP